MSVPFDANQVIRQVKEAPVELGDVSRANFLDQELVSRNTKAIQALEDEDTRPTVLDALAHDFQLDVYKLCLDRVRVVGQPYVQWMVEQKLCANYGVPFTAPKPEHTIGPPDLAYATRWVQHDKDRMAARHEKAKARLATQGPSDWKNAWTPGQPFPVYDPSKKAKGKQPMAPKVAAPPAPAPAPAPSGNQGAPAEQNKAVAVDGNATYKQKQASQRSQVDLDKQWEALRLGQAALARDQEALKADQADQADLKQQREAMKDATNTLKRALLPSRILATLPSKDQITEAIEESVLGLHYRLDTVAGTTGLDEVRNDLLDKMDGELVHLSTERRDDVARLQCVLNDYFDESAAANNSFKQTLLENMESQKSHTKESSDDIASKLQSITNTLESIQVGLKKVEPNPFWEEIIELVSSRVRRINIAPDCPLRPATIMEDLFHILVDTKRYGHLAEFIADCPDGWWCFEGMTMRGYRVAKPVGMGTCNHHDSGFCLRGKFVHGENGVPELKLLLV